MSRQRILDKHAADIRRLEAQKATLEEQRSLINAEILSLAEAISEAENDCAYIEANTTE